MTQMEIINREEERRDDEREADVDRDNDFELGEGQPRLKKALRLLGPLETRWNSTYYLIKLSSALKDSSVMFTIPKQAHNGEHPATSPVNDNVEVFIRSYSCSTTTVHPSYAGKLCPHSDPRNTQNKLGILVKLRRSRRMHGATEDAELVVESSTDPTIHNTLEHLLIFLYKIFHLSPKLHIGACTAFNAFVDSF